MKDRFNLLNFPKLQYYSYTLYVLVEIFKTGVIDLLLHTECLRQNDLIMKIN